MFMSIQSRSKFTLFKSISNSSTSNDNIIKGNKQHISINIVFSTYPLTWFDNGVSLSTIVPRINKEYCKLFNFNFYKINEETNIVMKIL